jgi:formylglycine-generating enzyme required for sulfatase activity/serine/threonine protein kinase
LAAGQQPLPDYELVRLLGRGGYGEVWLAKGPGGVEVALKFVRLEERAGTVELRALELMKSIQHAHLLHMSGIWQRDGLLIVAMELADGTLMDRLRQAQAQGLAGIPPAELLEYMREAAKGLDYLNEFRDPSGSGTAAIGIQHKDVKPQNLLLVGGTVKVADFGLAKLLEHSMTAASGGLTPAYAAPEFFNNKATRWSDQYSLAVSYCQLRGGRLPFQGAPMQVMAGHLGRKPDLAMLPEAERSVVARALSKKAKERWPSCREFVLALQAAVSDPVAKGPGRSTVPLPASAAASILGAPTVLPGRRPPPGQQKTVKVPPPLPPRQPEPSRSWNPLLLWLPLALLAVTAVGGWFLLSGTSRGPGKNTQLTHRLLDTSKSGVSMPQPLDCTGADGVSAAEVRKAQEAWAKYLGRSVEETVEVADGVNMTFMLVPPGKFLMGSPTDEKDRDSRDELHQVTLTEPFEMGKTEVTQAQYQALAGHNPSKFKGADKPVEQVSWEDARAYAAMLTKTLDDRCVYRLPTEAEWEYCCRGGRPSSKPFGIGDGRTLSSREANFNGEFPFGGADKGPWLGATCRVGSYPANALGLMDMHGNVWEWCADWLADYPSGAATNPTGPTEGSFRVFRGGCCNTRAVYCRASHRWLTKGDHTYYFGFRLARSIPSGGK